MRKALIPMVASLAVCGAATAALIANTAHADQATAKKPLLVAMAAAPSLPASAPTILPPPMPGEDFGGPDMMGPDMIAPPDMAGGPDSTDRRAQFCKNMYARKVGELAFLETKLSLTPAQTPLFARWKQTSMDIAGKHQSECATFKRPDGRPGIADRLNMEEKLLKIRLSDIQAEKPSLVALAQALTPEQQEELGRAGMAGMGGRMHMMMGMMGRGGMRGRMGHGPEAPPPAQ
jgi:hypothetical protein